MMLVYFFFQKPERAALCKSIFKVCLFLAVLMPPWAVHAAGLGNLTVNSALGQPFKAEVDLVAVKKEEMSSLAARLASREAFRKADVDYALFLSTLTVSVETRSNGQPYVRIASPQPVVEPFLSMLIELNWASGRLLREYTVLLDLPETDIPPPIAPATQIAPAVPSIVESEPIVVEKPDAPIKDFISDKKLAVREPVPVGRTSASYGPVRSGDTLSRIARQVAPDGVNLDQMLVALHRVNRDAFSGNDINRLKVGLTLRVPDTSEIAKISPAEAAIEVKTQIANWNAYRQKLAATTGAASATGVPKKTANGMITTIAKDNSASAREPSKEVLKLSKGEELGGAGGKGVSASQDRIRAMEEDAIAGNKALNEANERIALLEKNIKEMQRLLELKSVTMVEAQKRAESINSGVTSPAAPMASPQPAPAPAPAVSAKLEDVNAAAAAPDASSVEATKPAEPAKPAVDSTVAPPPVPVESSLMDELMQNIEYVGGVLALLLTGMLGIFMMRRKKETPAGGSDVSGTPHIAEPRLPDEVLPVAAPSAVVQTDEVDPVAEAEIHLDYGRDIQAEKTLTEALAKDPGRPEILARLLEVYVLRKDSVAFEVTARALQAMAPSGHLWERAAGLGAGIDPGNPLYGDAAAIDIGAIKGEISVPEPAPVSALDFAPLPESDLADIDLNMGEPPPGLSTDTKPAEGAHWHEIATKIDLARAYQEMGDNDGAREILEEVVREGDAQQQESARTMLASL
jgi:pilus assembly protein FimV